MFYRVFVELTFFLIFDIFKKYYKGLPDAKMVYEKTLKVWITADWFVTQKTRGFSKASKWIPN